MVMLSAVCVMALAGVLFLLFVVPTMHGGASASMAQEDPAPPEAMAPGAPPGAGGAPDPIEDPAMMAPGGAAPGAMTPAGASGSAGSASSATASIERTSAPPLENSSANPFVSGGRTEEWGGLANLKVTSYGTDWSKIPITARVVFPDAEVPERAAPAPPPAVIGSEKPLRVTSVMWTKDGQALAVYEYGEGQDVESGVVRPGDVVDTWRVAEIHADYITIVDRSSGTRDNVYLSEKAPEPKKATPAQGSTSRRSGRSRPSRP